MKQLLAGILLALFTINSHAQSLNPAVTQANIHETICVSGWTASIRPSVSYTSKVKRSMLNEGIKSGIYKPTAKMSDFVLDHVLSLGIGGAPKDRKNLILQSISDGLAKDKIEALVRHRVCSGRISLATGQAVFFNQNWETYK
jgi:hydrogenase maturation factor HypF (carbamoyltransferase family)